MELFACDLHINQILVDNSTGGVGVWGSGAGRGAQGCEGVFACVAVCTSVYVGGSPPPLCSSLPA